MLNRQATRPVGCILHSRVMYRFDTYNYDESLKAYLAPTGLVSEPRGDLTCRGDLRLEVPKTV